MTWDPAWMVPGAGGKSEKSPMATPFLPAEMEKILRIRHHRTIATQGTGWSPSSGPGFRMRWEGSTGSMWTTPMSALMSGLCSVSDVAPAYKVYDYREFSEDSARWAVDFVEKLMLLRGRPRSRTSRRLGSRSKTGFSAARPRSTPRRPTLAKGPGQGREIFDRPDDIADGKIVQMFRDLRKRLLTKYTGDIV